MLAQVYPMSNSWRDFVIEKFWPWFIKFVWPLIRDHVRDLVRLVLDDLVKSVKKWHASRTQAREQVAIRRAVDAERAAEGASNASEREKHEAIAQVWREVAEMFRQENEELKAKLDTLTAELNAEAGRRITASEPTVQQHGSGLRLLMAGGNGADLPGAD